MGLLMAHAAHHITQFQQLKEGDYTHEADTWRGMKQHIYVVADALGQGLAAQFPDKMLDEEQEWFYKCTLTATRPPMGIETHRKLAGAARGGSHAPGCQGKPLSLEHARHQCWCVARQVVRR